LVLEKKKIVILFHLKKPLCPHCLRCEPCGKSFLTTKDRKFSQRAQGVVNAVKFGKKRLSQSSKDAKIFFNY
jgi:hypothetical protein